MIIAQAIEPKEEVISRVHYCEKCYNTAKPTDKSRGITPHYIWLHRTEGREVLYFASCQTCDCRTVRGRDGLPKQVARQKHACRIPVTEWNALMIFEDHGY